MSKKRKSSDGDAQGSGKAGKLKTIGLAVGFALVGAVVGPKVLGGGASAAPAAEATTTTTAPGPVVALDAVTLNLSDGHLLQVGLAFELDPEAASHGDDGHGGGGADDSDPTKGYAKALDAAIDVLGNHSMATLAAAGGRESAKAELEDRLEAVYHGEIVGVYFHRFVMQ